VLFLLFIASASHDCYFFPQEPSDNNTCPSIWLSKADQDKLKHNILWQFAPPRTNTRSLMDHLGKVSLSLLEPTPKSSRALGRLPTSCTCPKLQGCSVREFTERSLFINMPKSHEGWSLTQTNLRHFSLNETEAARPCGDPRMHGITFLRDPVQYLYRMHKFRQGQMKKKTDSNGVFQLQPLALELLLSSSGG